MRLIVAIVLPAYLSTIPVVLFLVFTSAPVTAARGCELVVSCFTRSRCELPNAHAFLHQVTRGAFQTQQVNVCWRAHASCKLFHGLLCIWSLSCNTDTSSRHSSIPPRQHCRELLLSHQIFFCHLETRCADRIALLHVHVHVLEALINVPTRREESVLQFCSFNCST